MTTFKSLSAESKREVEWTVRKKFGRLAVVTENEQIQVMYPTEEGRQPYQPIHGYLSIGADLSRGGLVCLVCDSTPDHGDEIVASINVH